MIWNAWKTNLGQTEKAIAYYQHALDSALETYGEAHPSVATIRNNLGGAYYEKGEYQKALGQFEQSLSVRRAILGESNPDTQVSYGYIQLTREKLGVLAVEDE